MLVSLDVFHSVTVGQRFPGEAILQKAMGLGDGVQARYGCDPEMQGSQNKAQQCLGQKQDNQKDQNRSTNTSSSLSTPGPLHMLFSLYTVCSFCPTMLILQSLAKWRPSPATSQPPTPGQIGSFCYTHSRNSIPFFRLLLLVCNYELIHVTV